MIKEGFIKEIGHEGLQTKKILERIPFDQFNWKPHEKSRELGKLAVHVAEIPRWASRILSAPEFVIGPAGLQPAEVHSTDDIVQLSQSVIVKVIEDLQNAKDEDLLLPWSFKRGEQLVFTLPRVAAIRAMAMSHLIHHRGQLSVYLRLLNVPVPGLYGPSADEI